MSETTAAPSAEPTTEAPSAPSTFDTAPVDTGASPAADPAPQEADAPAEPAESKVVPLAALHEERNRRKELAEQVRTMERRFGDIQRMLQQQAQPRPAEPEIPDVQVDPVAHFKAKTEALERQLAQVTAPIQAQQQDAAFVNAYRAAAAEFAAETPDFHAAYDHAWKALAADGAVLGISAAEVERAVVSRAMQEGVNPARRLYEYAKARGYGAKPAASPSDGLAAMQRGAAAARSAAAAPAPAEGGQMTAQRLASLPIILRQSASLILANSLIGEADWRRMMGG